MVRDDKGVMLVSENDI